MELLIDKPCGPRRSGTPAILGHEMREYPFDTASVVHRLHRPSSAAGIFAKSVCGGLCNVKGAANATSFTK